MAVLPGWKNSVRIFAFKMDEPQKKPNKTYAFETAKVLSVAFEMGFIIALPIVFLGALGKHFDDRHHTHWFVYIAIVVSLAISCTWLYLRIKELAEKLKQASEHKEEKKE